MGQLARLVALAVVALPTAGNENPPQIAFKQFPGNRQAIVRLDDGGEGLLELTRAKPNPSVYGSFSWSPDGHRLVYASDGIVGGDLYSVDAEGEGLQRLTFQGGNDHPAWSPDGRRIAYVHTDRVRLPSGLFRLDQEIWVLEPAGAARRLTHDARQKFDPRWSPDGTRIAYSRLESGTFVIDAESGRLLARLAGSSPEWSPDGGRLVVQDTAGLAVVAADGGGRRTVARDGAANAVWSPDGSWIAFDRRHCVSYFRGICSGRVSSISLVRPDGTGERRLTGPVSGGPGSTFGGRPLDESMEPAWWPDGSRLFFVRGLFGQALRVVNADGRCEQPFGPSNLQLGQAAWRPRSTPSFPPLRCVDLRVRAATTRFVYGTRNVPKIQLVVENDGNETAAEIVLRLHVARGRGRIRPSAGSCEGTAIVRCELPALAPGASHRLVVALRATTAGRSDVIARVASPATDSDPATNSTGVYVYVLSCGFVGTPGRDRITGTDRRDTICGLPGGDVIVARAGDDVIDAGAGSDVIRPGPGRDRVRCGDGRDTVFGDRLDRIAHDCERVTRR